MGDLEGGDLSFSHVKFLILYTGILPNKDETGHHCL